jgi:hypothetical protein
MVNTMRHTALISIALTLSSLSLSGCSKQPANQSNQSQTNTSSLTKTFKAKSGATGTITASPNPIQICDGSGFGIASLSWSAAGARLVEVRVGAPDGILFVQSGPEGRKTTPKWASNGLVFYLQDASSGSAASPENTIATVTISTTTAGCP